MERLARYVLHDSITTIPTTSITLAVEAASVLVQLSAIEHAIISSTAQAAAFGIAAIRAAIPAFAIEGARCIIATDKETIIPETRVFAGRVPATTGLACIAFTSP